MPCGEEGRCSILWVSRLSAKVLSLGRWHAAHGVSWALGLQIPTSPAPGGGNTR